MAKYRGKASLLERNTAYIFVEGDTEHTYFNLIRKSLPRDKNIKLNCIKTNEKTPGQYVKYAKGYLKSLGYTLRDLSEGDSIFCVFDHDSIDDTQLQNAISAKSDKIEFIISNPNFEIWLLLHFQYYSHVFSKEEPLYKLNDFVSYSKPNIGPIFEQLENIREVAIENSIRLRRYHENNGTPLFSKNANPHTFVDVALSKIN